WVVNFQWTVTTSSSGNQDQEFLINIFKKVMSLVIFGVLAPLCPFAHVLDCLLSMLLYQGAGTTANRPASGILCLITAFLVVFVRDVGDLIIMIIRIIVFFLSLIFGVSAVGDISSITQLLTDFFTVLGKTIEKILLLFLTFALTELFNALYDICVYVVQPFSPSTIDCSSLSANGTLANILNGIGVTPLDSPENVNYKREVHVNGFAENTWDENNCSNLFNSAEYGALFQQTLLKGKLQVEQVCLPSNPSQNAFLRTPVASETYRPMTQPKAQGSFTRDRRNLLPNDIKLNVMQVVIMQH